MSSPDTSKNRGPGRPPLRSKTQLTRNGIVDEPSKLENIPQLQRVVEFYYDNPLSIKKIFGLFKHMNSKKVNIYFQEEKIVFIATDFKGENDIHIEILCSEVNSYYIEEPFTVGLNLSNIKNVMNKITKDFQSITIWCNRDERGAKLNIELFNHKLNNPTTSRINLQNPDSVLSLETIEEKLNNLDNYPIKFELESKIFKKKITDALGLGPKLRIEKDGDEPLTLITDHSEGVGTDDDVFNDPETIALESNIGNDMFSTTVYLSKLKALASALISDKIKIAVDKYDPIIFTATLDTDVSFVHVLTPVIDFRNI
jgi:hypothetical protein